MNGTLDAEERLPTWPVPIIRFVCTTLERMWRHRPQYEFTRSTNSMLQIYLLASHEEINFRAVRSLGGAAAARRLRVLPSNRDVPGSALK
ncbi:hypothetical protein EVAR_26717_1 [Eumeta japonica]|uniref:Uncharacterized protein n=1 Tax=Eumeta variegata TaxID=151549 RepID=A0A4C1XDP1_EUMVA|nr:hypothetical protein EVAR_26717_1 [Eumeta japonica]